MSNDNNERRDQYIEINDVEPVVILGLNDQHLYKIELAYPQARLTARGNQLKIHATDEEYREIRSIINELIQIALKNGAIMDDDINTILALKNNAARKDGAGPVSDEHPILTTHNDEAIHARTPGQKQIVEASAKDDITFAIGPAGTGKTYTSVALAVRALKERQVKKIVLVRPAVEAGESLGFLPGDLKEKIDPYLRPLYDALEEMLDFERLEVNMKKNVIEIAPLAYMRGRTLNNAFVILDEAQNATHAQLKMFLTRLGINSKAIVTGDITQSDLPHNRTSGLAPIREILGDVEGVSFVYLGDQDVVRHKLVRDIIKAYENHEKEQKESKERDQ